MKKIISLFQRNYDGDHLVRNEIVPGAEWVVAGEGIATRKLDGSCCMVRGGKLFKRYDRKRGKAAPPEWEAAQEADPITGHQPGWIPVGDGPDDQWFREAISDNHGNELADGTHELIGPKVQGNAEHEDQHILVRHGDDVLPDAPRTFDTLREWLSNRPTIEGIVWHHPDGRMVKIKRRDFGLAWPTPQNHSPGSNCKIALKHQQPRPA